MQQPSIRILVKELVAGETTLEDVAAEFARRDWSEPELTLLEAMGGDAAELYLPANEWSPAEAAYRAGNLSEKQYQALRKARQDSRA